NLDRAENSFDRLRIHRLAGKCAVEIDDMEMLETLRLERRRLRCGVAMKYGRARHVALFEPHGFAVLQVDGRKENHGKILSSFRTPSAARRSGIQRWIPGSRTSC